MGKNKIALRRKVQTVGQEVDGAVRRLFCDHIQMALQNDSGRGLVARCCGLDDDNVVEAVLIDLQSALFSKTAAVVADGLGVAGAVRNAAQVLKDGHDIFWFKMLQYSHDNTILSKYVLCGNGYAEGRIAPFRNAHNR